MKVDLSYGGLVRLAITVIAVAMALYHMWAIAFGSPEAFYFRGTHLMFAMSLVFMLYPTRPGQPAWRALDAALLALGLAFVLHILLNYDYFINRIIYIDDLTRADRFFAVDTRFFVLAGALTVDVPLVPFAFTTSGRSGLAPSSPYNRR